MKCTGSIPRPILNSRGMHEALQLAFDFLFGAHEAPTASVSDPQEPRAVPTPARYVHPRANRHTQLCGSQVAYQFTRRRRRSIGMLVGEAGLEVSAPRWVPLYEVEAALQEKAAWILRKLDEMQERAERAQAARIQWRDGTSLPVLGQSVTLALGARQTALEPPILHLALPHDAAPEKIRDAAHAWLLQEARRLFAERLDHYAPQLGVQWRKLSLSNAQTRWGSAGVDGSIRLNWRLMHFDLRVIDYVVVHELSHLRVMNHSPRFWATVASVMPDHEERRRALRDENLPKWT